jgi:hypothetical protein
MSYPEPKYPGASGDINAVLRRAGHDRGLWRFRPTGNDAGA